MSYDDLIDLVAHQTGYTATVVKNILGAMPDVLLQLRVGDKVRTPLGVFSMNFRKKRPIKRPDGAPAIVEEKLVVRLKPGVKLQRDPRPAQTGRPPSPSSP